MTHFVHELIPESPESLINTFKNWSKFKDEVLEHVDSSIKSFVSKNISQVKINIKFS